MNWAHLLNPNETDDIGIHCLRHTVKVHASAFGIQLDLCTIVLNRFMRRLGCTLNVWLHGIPSQSLIKSSITQ
jgi:hypothetical protein